MLIDTKEQKDGVLSSLNAVKQRSAMNPILWMLGILASAMVFTGCMSASEWLKMLIAVLFSVCVIAAIGIYIYFAIKSPDKLRSEEYQARYDVLQFYQRMQSKEKKPVDIVVKNPELED